jgi:hypothetical protein
MAPLAQLPLALGSVIWYVLTAAAIGASVFMAAALPGETRRKAQPQVYYGLPLLALAVVLIPGVLRSQASPFMGFFMIAALYCLVKDRPIAAGFSLACAALLKVFPIVLIVYFIVRRQWRAVLATGAALVLLGVVLPSLYWGWQFNLDQIARWVDVVGHPTMKENTARAQVSELYDQLLNTTKPRNQSLEALFLSLGMPATLTHYSVAASAALMLAAMWACARRLPPRQPGVAESLLCGAFICWSLVISPIAEGHYFGALLLPLAALVAYADLCGASRRRYLAGGTVFMISALVLSAFNVTAVWRPLCLATLVIWLLCLRLSCTVARRQESAGGA